MLYESLLLGIGSLMLVFIACEFAQRLINTYEKIEDTIKTIHWHLLPNDMHLMFRIISMYAQQPLEIRFFGSAACSRDRFKEVSEKERVFGRVRMWAQPDLIFALISMHNQGQDANLISMSILHR